MDINRDNYEAWLLDRDEGKLSPEKERRLNQFLKDNPDLEDTFDLSDIVLPPYDSSYPLKEDLKKGGMAGIITRLNFEQFCIARIEGELSDSAERALESFLNDNPDCERISRIYYLTKLRPDHSVCFPDRNILKRTETLKVPLYGYFRKRTLYLAVSVAASVAILVMASILVRNNLWVDSQLPATIDQDLQYPAGETEADESEGTYLAESRETNDILINDESLASSLLEVNNHLPEVLVKEQENVHGIEFDRDPGLLPLTPAYRESNVQIGSMQIAPYPAGLALQAVTPKIVTTNGRPQSGNIINGLLGFLTKTLDSDSDRERLTIWDIADVSVRGINTIAGTDLRLDREFNSEGDLVSMAFSSQIIEIQRSTRIYEE